VVPQGPEPLPRLPVEDAGHQRLEHEAQPARPLIIGVLADDLQLPESFDAWAPLRFTADQLTPQGRSNHFLRVIGRLARGATLADARAELAVVSARLRAAFPAVYPADAGFEMTAVPLLDQMVGHVRTTLWMLFGAVVLVLLMACAWARHRNRRPVPTRRGRPGVNRLAS